MLRKNENWRIYRSKSRGVMIEYRDPSGKLLLALNYQADQARQLADQLLTAVEEQQNEPSGSAI